MCICMAESLCYPPETITTMLTGYNPIQNKKLKKKISEHFFYMLFYWILQMNGLP